MRPIVRAPRDERDWSEAETAQGEWADARLNHRLEVLVAQLSEGLGESIPLACQDWAATQAAYRFLASPRVREQAMLEGHFKATRDRLRARPGWMLILHDTTEFSCHRQDEAALGLVSKRLERRVGGLRMHSRLAMTPQGRRRGLGAIQCWTRQPHTPTHALKRAIKPTRVPVEQKASVRWLENLRPSTQWFGEAERRLPIGDREGDLDERFGEAGRLATHCRVRAGVDSAGR